MIYGHDPGIAHVGGAIAIGYPLDPLVPVSIPDISLGSIPPSSLIISGVQNSYPDNTFTLCLPVHCFNSLCF